MKNISYLLFIFILISCSKVDDDTDESCSNNCTTLTVKFLSLNNEPVPGISVSLQYKYGGGIYPSYTRNIINATSDENGLIQEEFYIKDDELGEAAIGYFILNVNDSNIDVTKYIRSNNLIGDTVNPMDNYIGQINNRDTIIAREFYIPKKAYIKVNLENFVPQQQGDRFEVRSRYPFGSNIGYNPILDSPYAGGMSGYGNFLATSSSTQLQLFVAEGEKNFIDVVRRKNGVNTAEEIPIQIPLNNTIELTYYY